MTALHPNPDSGLLIRVWTEPAAPSVLRARVLSFQGDAEPVSVATAAGEEAVLTAVRTWIHAKLPAAAGPAQP
jgi:hypothetical protein